MNAPNDNLWWKESFAVSMSLFLMEWYWKSLPDVIPVVLWKTKEDVLKEANKVLDKK